MGLQALVQVIAKIEADTQPLGEELSCQKESSPPVLWPKPQPSVAEPAPLEPPTVSECLEPNAGEPDDGSIAAGAV